MRLLIYVAALLCVPQVCSAQAPDPDGLCTPDDELIVEDGRERTEQVGRLACKLRRIGQENSDTAAAISEAVAIASEQSQAAQGRIQAAQAEQQQVLARVLENQRTLQAVQVRRAVLDYAVLAEHGSVDYTLGQTHAELTLELVSARISGERAALAVRPLRPRQVRRRTAELTCADSLVEQGQELLAAGRAMEAFIVARTALHHATQTSRVGDFDIVVVGDECRTTLKR
jgi:hypothetical protein